jgi:phenylalanyl-tRNA synthetase beta chain
VSIGAYGEDMDFYKLKGWVEELLRSLRTKKPEFAAEKSNPSYHPGRCAKVYVEGECVGVFGQIDPRVAKNYGVDAEFYCAELSFAAMYKLRGAKPVYQPLPRFPSINRDIADAVLR